MTTATVPADHAGWLALRADHAAWLALCGQSVGAETIKDLGVRYLFDPSIPPPVLPAPSDGTSGEPAPETTGPGTAQAGGTGAGTSSRSVPEPPAAEAAPGPVPEDGGEAPLGDLDAKAEGHLAAFQAAHDQEAAQVAVPHDEINRTAPGRGEAGTQA